MFDWDFWKEFQVNIVINAIKVYLKYYHFRKVTFHFLEWQEPKVLEVLQT